LDSDGALLVSAKQGIGIDELFEAIVHRIPAPTGTSSAPLRALIFDCHYDPYRGVIVHVRVFDGTIRRGMKIRFMYNNSEYEVENLGIFKIALVEQDELNAGSVGYVIAGLKPSAIFGWGDTVTSVDNPCDSPLPGFREIKPVVFSSIYPVDSNDYDELKTSLEKLKLNDASLVFEKDSSAALGFGFRCGFLGLLHLEIVQERLEREFDQSIIFTAPSVRYKIHLRNGEEVFIDNPSEYPDEGKIESAEEPYIRAAIITPTTYLGAIMTLCLENGVYRLI